jgi:ATP-dependent DNA helicase RecQ
MTINRVAKYLEHQNQLKISQLQSVLHYVSEKNQCKNKSLLAYFGEKVVQDCGICSYCIGRNKKTQSLVLTKPVLDLLMTQPMDSRQILKMLAVDFAVADADVIFALQTLLENEIITLQPNNKYTLRK